MVIVYPKCKYKAELEAWKKLEVIIRLLLFEEPFSNFDTPLLSPQ